MEFGYVVAVVAAPSVGGEAFVSDAVQAAAFAVVVAHGPDGAVRCDHNLVDQRASEVGGHYSLGSVDAVQAKALLFRHRVAVDVGQFGNSRLPECPLEHKQTFAHTPRVDIAVG